MINVNESQDHVFKMLWRLNIEQPIQSVLLEPDVYLNTSCTRCSTESTVTLPSWGYQVRWGLNVRHKMPQIF